MLKGSTFYPGFYNNKQRRINKLNIPINDDKHGISKDEYLIIAIDSTGIKITNRGQWIRDEWNIRKGYLKIHVAVNIKSKKILSMKVTDEHHVHDSKALPELVDDIIKSDKIVGKLIADSAYDNNDIFKFIVDNGILPCIKLRKNAQVRLKKGNILRNLSVISQRNDLQKWKDSVSYDGQRWIAETVFSSIKRKFGKYVYSVKFENMVKEMMLKAAALYNKMISI
jgi:hypothetical protein